MDFELSRQLVNRLDYVESTGSTNTDLIAAGSQRPDLSVLVAGFQTAGRGRSGREWLAPDGSSLFVSVLLRPETKLHPDAYGWLPLMAGLAMARAVASFIPADLVSVKWPNDVLVSEQKISGVLSELLPDLSGVVIGAGLNIRQGRGELPIETATSMAIEGATDLSHDEILAAYLGELRSLYSAFVAAGGDAVKSGLHAAVTERCASIGRRVRVIMPAEAELYGKAVAIDATGRIVIEAEPDASRTSVSAGDIIHLRHN